MTKVEIAAMNAQLIYSSLLCLSLTCLIETADSSRLFHSRRHFLVGGKNGKIQVIYIRFYLRKQEIAVYIVVVQSSAQADCFSLFFFIVIVQGICATQTKQKPRVAQFFFVLVFHQKK
jgi:hypothetical protein